MTKHRRTTRTWDTNAWSPISHNAYVQTRKRHKRLNVQFRTVMRAVSRTANSATSATKALRSLASAFLRIGAPR